MKGTGGEGRGGGKGEEGREGKEGRLDGRVRGGRKGRDEGKGKGRGREGVGRGNWCPLPHDLFATRPCQYSGRREASFQLSNATICPRGSKLWCSDLAVDNALRG